MRKLGICVAALALFTGCSEAAEEPVATSEFPALSGRTFGAYVQQEYEENYQEALPRANVIANRFVDDYDDTDAKSFYWNMQGAKPQFIERGDATPNAGLDTVDHVFLVGHGGAWPLDASLPYASGISAFIGMWDIWQLAGTADMRLGDDSRQLSIFSAYTCEIHAGGSYACTTPGNIEGPLWVDRWRPVFRGGLRMSTGAVECTHTGSSFDDVGRRYSNNLQAGQTIQTAWTNAVNIGSAQDPSLVSAGANETDCWARMDTMTLANHATWPRLRDAAVRYYCKAWWQNI